MVQSSLFDLSLLLVEMVVGLSGDALIVHLVLPVVRQQRPDCPGILVGQRHRCDVFVAPRHHFVDPAAAVSALARVMNDDACAVNQERSQVGVAALADAQQVLLAPAGVLPGHQAQPGGHLPARRRCEGRFSCHSHKETDVHPLHLAAGLTLGGALAK